MLPGDVITVVRDPQTFTAFGATGRSEKIPFDTAGVTLEEAIARRAASLRFSAWSGVTSPVISGSATYGAVE